MEEDQGIRPGWTIQGAQPFDIHLVSDDLARDRGRSSSISAADIEVRAAIGCLLRNTSWIGRIDAGAIGRVLPKGCSQASQQQSNGPPHRVRVC